MVEHYSASIWKDYVNAVIGKVGMLLSLRALKSLNNRNNPIENYVCYS